MDNKANTKPIPTLETCVYVGERMEEHRVATDWGNSDHPTQAAFSPVSESVQDKSVNENSKPFYMGDME